MERNLNEDAPVDIDEDEVAGWVRSPKHFYELLLRN